MRSRVFCFALAFLFGAFSLSGRSQGPDEKTAEFVVLPEIVHQISGKYPDVHVVLFRVGCGQDDKKQWHNQLPPETETYSLDISGAGYAATNPQRDDDCTVSFDLKTSSTEHGSVVVNVRTSKEHVGKAFLHFADPLTGPIPTKSPEVDVLWAPISYDVCNQAFGRAVAKKFFCIAVKIGNNSGYQLQIAGVGFNTPFGSATDQHLVKTPNSSYALTRSVAQEGSYDSPRSYVLHGIEATGLLMASATPYFHNVRSTAKFATATSIVAGPLEAAFNLMVPDHSLRQANNLDDQSLRDGKLIPNNTQITTVVFLDKGSVTLDYKRACDRLYGSYDGSLATTKQAKNGSQGLVNLAEASIFSKVDRSVVSAKIRAQDQLTAKRYDACTSGDSSALKEALGALVVVGDEIQYLQRVVVDQTVHSQETPVGAQPASSAISYQTLSITGRNLDKLPATLNITSGVDQRVATRDSSSTAEAATYSFKGALKSNAAYTVQSSGTALPLDLHGNVQNPNASVDGAKVVGDTLMLTGEALDLLPPSLEIYLGEAKQTLTRSSVTGTTATFPLDASRDKAKVITIKNQEHLKVTGSSVTATSQ